MNLKEYYFKTETSSQVDMLSKMVRRYRHIKIKNHYIFFPTFKDAWIGFKNLDWDEYWEAFKTIVVFILLPLQIITFFIPRIVVRNENVLPTRYVNNIDMAEIKFPEDKNENYN